MRNISHNSYLSLEAILNETRFFNFREKKLISERSFSHFSFPPLALLISLFLTTIIVIQITIIIHIMQILLNWILRLSLHAEACIYAEMHIAYSPM